jgi:organic hydroperoxide reductase OsmC/OhrA
MAEYIAQVIWTRSESSGDFLAQRYSRAHLLRFDGGAEWSGSSSPHVVPQPFSDTAAVDPEEAFVAALSSCHMLWFLSIAAQRRFCVERYVDDAVGLMGKGANGKPCMTVVTLRPAVLFTGSAPTHEQLMQLHHDAHDECFIANSVKTEVRCQPAAA